MTNKYAAIALLALGGCFFMPKKMKVVPASEAPPPEPGTGWQCYDYQETRVDTHDGTSQSSSGDRCKRTLAECQESALSTANTPTGGARTEIHYQVGSCVAQASAACTYIWGDAGKGMHECYRSIDSCSSKVGGFAATADMKQSECAIYQ